MKKKLYFLAMLVYMLALSLSFIGCPTDGGGGGGSGGSGSEAKLYGTWGTFPSLTFSSPNKFEPSVGDFTGTYTYDEKTLTISGGGGNGTVSIPATIANDVLTLGAVSGGEGTEVGEVMRAIVGTGGTYKKQ
ncbi:MAG: hypothetical protein LBC57_11130 [Treponema sp.]|nr:hypothetical protein [Treponema sp.]